MNAEAIVSLLTEFTHPSQDQERFKNVEQQLSEIKANPSNIGLALELLNSYSQQSVVWFACMIISDVITYLWVPRSMEPDPSKSQLTPELKLQIRQFFVEYLNNRIDALDEVSRNFIFKLIVSLMKIDFTNEGVFWVSYAQSILQNPQRRWIGYGIFRFLSDELQSFSDHSITSKTKLYLRQTFISLVPDICRQVVVLLRNTQPDDPSNEEAFVLLKSFLIWISPIYISTELVETVFMYSRSSMGKISLRAHQYIHTLFYRYDVISVHPIEFRAQLLRIVFGFFESEMKQFGSQTLSLEYIQSLLHAFQPFAANYFFKEDTFDPSIVSQFLTNFEGWTWAAFGTSNFALMIEIWGDLFHGQEGSQFWMPEKQKYQIFFITLVEHCLDAMVSPIHIPRFTEDDYLAINDIINEIAMEYTDELCRLVQRATATAVNANLPSIFPLLTCFFHVISRVGEDDPVNESISDSLLRYLNELMTKQLPIDVQVIFPIVQTIIKSYVKKFSRNSLHFVEKVFHLLTVSVNLGPNFVQPMLELMLETLKIHRPISPCKMILAKMMDMQQIFCGMSLTIYSLYICCCETMAAYYPTDCGSRPLADAGVIRQIFSIVFANLSSQQQLPYALLLLRDAVNNIAFSTPIVKELVFTAFVPYIDVIMNIYESRISENVLLPLLDFIAAFCTIFPTQIAERMSELINRLFAPLANVLPSLADGSFEHFATLSFLKILFQLSYFRTAVSEHQTANIAEFLVRYADPLFHCQSVDVQILCFKIVQTLIRDRRSLLSPEIQSQLLHILFFNGVCSEDANSVKISITTIMECHKLYQLLDTVDVNFRFNAFSAICNEMCKCSNTMMRESMVEFAVFFCAVAPDFRDMLLIPFIQQLPITESDRAILAQSFNSFRNELEFKKIFVDFCDDVSYLLTTRPNIELNVSSSC
ncbi:Importin-beta N-terminal domain containing protein [Tritrichomonas foetus]|uniref:Importin-beta N-terminal domain containing protein n=1 Tax=Tritrichomonas foetus TaxID=1144522 RepID=A0A1J4JFD9_9EUKA|nr:Importin-beta N-terminal domain containing protein [Tritrichomonas foetus]|eukprot:OHS97007.1 Importin-beta N-terminal domain containing protein [Tritrichomonas foetus]